MCIPVYYALPIAMYPFYATTLEVLHTDKMDLPLINAATEGCLAVGIMKFITIFIGP